MAPNPNVSTCTMTGAHWTNKFSLRHNNPYNPHDGQLLDPHSNSTEDCVTAFFHVASGDSVFEDKADDPKILKLKAFLDMALDDPYCSIGTHDDFVLLDDRQDTEVFPANPRPMYQLVGTEGVEGGVEGYDSGLRDQIKCSGKLNLGEFVKHMNKRSDGGARRTTAFFADITPGPALALAITAPGWSAPVVRAFLGRHLMGQPYFGATTDQHFALEFHLPFLALRTGPEKPDTRLDKRAQPLRAASLLPLHPSAEEAAEHYHEASLSLVVVGLDEWQWSAYCLVDTYFEPSRRKAAYATEPDYDHWEDPDGPAAGGANEFKGPMWNPREYFLVVLARRVQQVVMAWRVLMDVMEDRLKAYKPTTDIDDNKVPEFDAFRTTAPGSTPSHISLLSTLHTFRRLLRATTSAWQTFEARNGTLFTLPPGPGSCTNMRHRWQDLLTDVRTDVAELSAMELRVGRRLEGLEERKRWGEFVKGRRGEVVGRSGTGCVVC
ncbi:hypothetical protein K490DRAFT_68722 [Saccharata proteae CBS 121410]|uniref:Uncharacterized protein n=1 Tax=Saccharata proteae CBS 121410 TaxID=1314787 RepID=A0A9P4HML6_9PEZI|nr:hypothetical protein K490DRAFT_68722 [Saccharata proteae CBS 121410]